MPKGKIAACLALILMMVAASRAADGTIAGVVKDGSGSVVAGAIVTLETAASTGQRTTVADGTGAFHFSNVAPGTYKVAISASGFAVWTADDLAPDATLSPVLQLPAVSSSVDVTLPPHELALEQEKAEEKQRVLGVFPHFFVTYEPNPAPLSAAQKFRLGWKTIIDPVTLFSTGLSAGIEQARNHYPEFGQGMEGYGKRFGARYANRVSGVFVGHVLMQTVFRQDPRYYYKSSGSFGKLLLYSIATAFVVKGDNGHWQPDYSDVIGGLATGEISTLYYPHSSRTGLRIFHGVLLGFAGRAENHLMEQFIVSKLTFHKPKTSGIFAPSILREGTPVSLISVEDLASNGAGPIRFVLASDMQVGGKVVAKAGAAGEGKATFSADGHVSLERVRLKMGNADVPLRSSRIRGGDVALQYHQLENSGRIALELYVAADVALPAGN